MIDADLLRTHIEQGVEKLGLRFCGKIENLVEEGLNDVGTHSQDLVVGDGALIPAKVGDVKEVNLVIIEVEINPIVIKGEAMQLRVVPVPRFADGREESEESAHVCKVGDKLLASGSSELILNVDADIVGLAIEGGRDLDTPHARSWLFPSVSDRTEMRRLRSTK